MDLTGAGRATAARRHGRRRSSRAGRRATPPSITSPRFRSDSESVAAASAIASSGPTIGTWSRESCSRVRCASSSRPPVPRPRWTAGGRRRPHRRSPGTWRTAIPAEPVRQLTERHAAADGTGLAHHQVAHAQTPRAPRGSAVPVFGAGRLEEEPADEGEPDAAEALAADEEREPAAMNSSRSPRRSTPRCGSPRRSRPSSARGPSEGCARRRAGARGAG